MPLNRSNSLPAGSHPGADQKLTVMTLNLQYFGSYPENEQLARERLRKVTGGAYSPDVICVQEGLGTRDVLHAVGYERAVSSHQRRCHSQTVHDMVYGDAGTLKQCQPDVHDQHLCNQIYIRKGSDWIVEHSGIEKVSGDTKLVGGEGRAKGKLAVRSVVWVYVRHGAKPHSANPVYVMCTHLSGGRFEDQYFVQDLAAERFNQANQIVGLYNDLRLDRDGDCILVGDFNATTEYTINGPMHNYFKFAIQNSEGVKADVKRANVQEEQLVELFKQYMLAPFTAIQDAGWSFAYTQNDVGASSGFGHLIDHMAMSRKLDVISSELIHLTNQKVPQNAPKDTDMPLTDHNAVKCVFSMASRRRTSAPSASNRGSDERVPVIPRRFSWWKPSTLREMLDGRLKVSKDREVKSLLHANDFHRDVAPE